MGSRIVALRKAKEIDPATEVLTFCLDEAKRDPSTPPVAVARLEEMKSLMGLLDDWYEQVSKYPKAQLLPLIKLGAKAIEMLGAVTGKKGIRE